MPTPRWWLTSLIFPGIWLASVVAVGTANVWWGFLLVWVCGLTSYVIAVRYSRKPWLGRGSPRSAVFASAKHASVLGLVIFGSGTLIDAYAGLTSVPTGEASDHGGDPTLDCEQIDFPPVRNRRDMVAAIRHLHCRIAFIGGYRDSYFVFVRRTNEKEARANLAFSYDLTYADPDPELPRESWNTDAQLRIAVKPQVRQVTEERSDVYGVAITYNVVAACPAVITPWQRAAFAVWHTDC